MPRRRSRGIGRHSNLTWAGYGLEGATISRIAEAAGLTSGAVYLRFPDKNALLETVLLSLLDSQYGELKAPGR